MPKRSSNINRNNIRVNKALSISSGFNNISSTNANSFLESVSKKSYNFNQDIKKYSKDYRYKEYPDQETAYNTLDLKPINKNIAFSNFFTVEN
jgi:hypothetical protein